MDGWLMMVDDYVWWWVVFVELRWLVIGDG